jgi:hypothetical protein
MIKTFEQIKNELAYQHLKNLSITDNQDLGVLDSAHNDQILSLLNQGIQDICTKVKLFEGIGVLSLLPNQNIYELDDIHFPEFIKVLSIHAIRQNDQTEVISFPKTNSHITMPSYSSIRFSNIFLDTYESDLDIHYQKSHPIVTASSPEVSLPRTYHEALLLYIASLYISHMGGEVGQEGDKFYGMYLKLLNDDIMENKSGTSELTDEDIRFIERGFV